MLRQISLCLERNQESAATRLRSSRLEPLVAGYRQTHGAAALSDERINEALAGERARVTEATLLCTVLAPMLADELQPASGRRRNQPPAAIAASRPPERGARPAGIADFIDEMIAQEEAPRPSRRKQPV